MTILTDNECREIYNNAMAMPERSVVQTMRVIEAAVLAKLSADVTLPEPKFAYERAADGVQGTHFYEVTNPSHIPVWAALYTADQLRAAYAAGVATRLGVA